MKWFIGFFVLLVALVAISGCTQPAQTTAPATTVPTTEPVLIATPVPTTEPVLITTPVMTTVATTVAPTVAPTTVTTVATTVTTNVPTTAQTTAANATLNMTVVVIPVKTVTAASMITTIHITSAGFSHPIDVVLPGTGISWANDDTVSHTVKSVGRHAGMFTSTEIDPNTQFKFDFDTVDTYEYILDNNPKINGTIIVKAGPSVVGA